MIKLSWWAGSLELSGGRRKWFRLLRMKLFFHKGECAWEIAPGLNGIKGNIIRRIAFKCTRWWMKILNILLYASNLCTEWKTARLVLVGKPKKMEGKELVYRPLSLLTEMGKLWEDTGGTTRANGESNWN